MSSGDTTDRGPGLHASPVASASAHEDGPGPGDVGRPGEGSVHLQLVDLRPEGGRPGGRAQLRIPAEPRSLRLARLVVAGVAADAGFTVDEVEDLRVAVDEACAAVMATGATPGHVHVAVDVAEDGGGRRVEVTTWSEPAVVPVVDAVPALLLEHTTEGWAVDGHCVRLWRTGTVSGG